MRQHDPVGEPACCSDQLFCYSAVVLSATNQEFLLQVLSQLAGHERGPCRIAVIDAGSRPANLLEQREQDGPRLHHWWVGDDLGTAGALDVGLRFVDSCDAVLVMDGALPVHVLIESLLAELDAGCDVVVAKTPEGDLRDGLSVNLDLLRWPPTLIRMSAMRHVGAPRAELFYAVDHWELLARLRRHGFKRRDVVSSADDLAPGGGERYPGHEHDLIVRNLTYLALYAGGLRRAAVARLLRYLRERPRGSTHVSRPGGTYAAARRGAARRLGPPDALRRLPS